MRRVGTCFMCGDPVLELEGQDVVLATVHLRERPSQPDAEALDAGAFGAVHLRCFVGSRWGPFWAARIREGFEEGPRGLPVRWESDDLVLIRHEVLSLRTTIAIRRDGWFGSLDDHQLRERRAVTGGALLPVRHDFNLEITEHGALWRDATMAFRRDGNYPLLRLVDGLNLRRRLWCEAALEHGRLEPAPSPEDEDADGELWIEAVSVYERFVPDDVLGPLLAILPEREAGDSKRIKRPS